jgi:hypothetical protein
MSRLFVVSFILCLVFIVFQEGIVYRHPKNPNVMVKEISNQEQKAASDFWTPERMAQAKPIEELLPSSFFDKFGMPSVQEPPAGKFEPDTDFVRPESLYQVHPYKTMGRAFFLFDNRTASCSASSSGNNAVLTAGHCLFIGDFHQRFVFVPQYNNRSEPAGRWPAKKLMIFNEWREMHMGRDLAFAIVEKLRDRSIDQAVGHMKFGPCDVNDKIQSFGYPGIPEEFGLGQKLIRTRSDIQRRFPFSPWEPAPLGYRSKQGPGSSGGPVIKNFKELVKPGDVEKENENIACSTNSFAVRFTYYVFGSFVDQAALEMHRTAIQEQ